MKYSVHVAMWVVSDERHLSYQKSVQSSILSRFCHQQRPAWQPIQNILLEAMHCGKDMVSSLDWKQCIVGRAQYLLWATPWCQTFNTTVTCIHVKLKNKSFVYFVRINLQSFSGNKARRFLLFPRQCNCIHQLVFILHTKNLYWKEEKNAGLECWAELIYVLLLI